MKSNARATFLSVCGVLLFTVTLGDSVTAGVIFDGGQINAYVLLLNGEDSAHLDYGAGSVYDSSVSVSSDRGAAKTDLTTNWVPNAASAFFQVDTQHGIDYPIQVTNHQDTWGFINFTVDTTSSYVISGFHNTLTGSSDNVLQYAYLGSGSPITYNFQYSDYDFRNQGDDLNTQLGAASTDSALVGSLSGILTPGAYTFYFANITGNALLGAGNDPATSVGNFRLDISSTAAVPEPASGILLGIGLFAIPMARRIRMRRQV